MTPTPSSDAVARAVHGQGLVDYARARGITVQHAAELSQQVARYASMTPKEQLSTDAKVLAVMRGISYTEALKRLGVQ